MESIFIIFALIGWLAGMILISKFIKRSLNPTPGSPVKKGCPPHEWQELETYPGSEIYFLKCKDCSKTLADVLGA